MKKMKFAAAVMIITAGSALYGAVPAKAGGIELEKVGITFKRNHDDAYDRGGYYREESREDYRRDVPPPPPPHSEYRGHRPPLPHRGGHMPPPPPPKHYREGHRPPPPRY